MKRILAVEIGGTFTDVVYLTGEGRLFTLKIASTPGKPEQGVFSAIEELRLDLPSLDELIHGSTIATNAIIERKGARAAFVTTGGFKDILNIQRGDKRNTYDTSTDVCLINRGKPEVNTENQIAGLPMGAPMIDIVNVGAGGGSIAWIDQGGMMRVGPQSAGAQPGPVCYGKGGQIPTVTDAYVAMGLLRPTQFIGGKFPLDKEKAVEALRLMAGRTGQQELELAESIFNIASHNALQAIRIICTERGYDARDYVLVAFGGAGPLHAAIMADEIGIQTVLVPRNAGLISALGLMLAEWKRDYCQTRLDRLDRLGEPAIESRFHSLEAQAATEFQTLGSSKQELEFHRSLDMRYEGQAYEINVALSDEDFSPSAIREHFRAAHQRRFGYIRDEADLLIVNYRISAVRRKDGIRLEDLYGPAGGKENSGSQESKPQEGRIFSKGRFHSAAFYTRSALRCGEQVQGPAVVEEYSSGCYVPQAWLARVDPLENLFLTRKA